MLRLRPPAQKVEATGGAGRSTFASVSVEGTAGDAAVATAPDAESSMAEEGAVHVRGNYRRKTVQGLGYVEMTGYVGRLRL